MATARSEGVHETGAGRGDSPALAKDSAAQPGSGRAEEGNGERILGVSFRDAVFFDGKKSLDVKVDKVLIDFHSAGVKVKGVHRTVIVPLANCLWIQVDG